MGVMCLAVGCLFPGGVSAQLPPTPQETGAKKGPAPKLYVAERAKSIGTVVEGDKPVVKWLLENRGDADLIIERTIPTCGCTVVTLSEDQRRIPPGGKVNLSAEFNSYGRPGKQQKGITVHSNDPAAPLLGLEFTAEVTRLFLISPSSVVNLRALARGQAADPPIQITPGPDHKKIEVLSVTFADDSGAMSAKVDPFETDTGATGQRITLVVGDDVALGPVSTQVTVKISVDGIERESMIPIQGEVVGDLTWLPRVVDHTRVPSRHGFRLSPITLRSNERKPFEILGTEITQPGLLDVKVESNRGGPGGTQYVVLLTIKDDAPQGPFGTELRIRTNSPDQPVVQVPLFGIVSPAVDFDPPIVVLRQDGTPAGTERRVRLQAAPQLKLEVSDLASDNPAVSVTLDSDSSKRAAHLSFLKVRLQGALPPGSHRATLRFRTSIGGAEVVQIPVYIEVPDGKG